ncbi:MAG: hypothetical protein SNJ59_02740 [Aggregatilineales bacterium]
MERISAARNLSIENQPERWRLIVNGGGSERVLMEARPGEPLRYVTTFGAQRRLPTSGMLPVENVERVVLGWSQHDEAWHLGLLLSDDLAQTRGSRWCGLAFWPDPQLDLYRDIASQAGQTLAQKLARPFTIVPPPTAAPRERAAAETSAAAPLPQLPLALHEWTLSREQENLLILVLGARWGRARLLKALWFLFLSAVFIVLSIRSLEGIIAPTQPAFLPYLGIASAVFLLGASLRLILTTLTRERRIEIDAATRTIRAASGKRTRWMLTADDLRGVYASHSLGKSRQNGQQRAVHYGELNLALKDGDFRCLLQHGPTEEFIAALDGDPQSLKREYVISLTPAAAQTLLQAAALYIAQALGVPAYFDQRAGGKTLPF